MVVIAMQGLKCDDNTCKEMGQTEDNRCASDKECPAGSQCKRNGMCKTKSIEKSPSPSSSDPQKSSGCDLDSDCDGDDTCVNSSCKKNPETSERGLAAIEIVGIVVGIIVGLIGLPSSIYFCKLYLSRKGFRRQAKQESNGELEMGMQKELGVFGS